MLRSIAEVRFTLVSSLFAESDNSKYRLQSFRMEEIMKEHKQKTGRVAEAAKYLFWSCFALMAAVVIGHLATAEGTLLKVTEKTVYVGDRINIALYFPEEQQMEDVTYALADSGEGNDFVELQENGTVTAKKAGTAKVTVSYRLPQSVVNTQETFTVNVLDPQEITAVYGEEIPALNAWEYYESEDYEIVLSGDSLSLQADKICVEGFEDATISLKKKENVKDDVKEPTTEDGKEDNNGGQKEPASDAVQGTTDGEQKEPATEDGQEPADGDQKEEESVIFEVARVKITSPVLVRDKLARATQTEAFVPEIAHFLQPVAEKNYRQDILDAGKVEWKIGDAAENETARATEQGILALKEGKTAISAILTAKNGDQKIIAGELTVTDPVLHTTQLVVAKGITRPLEITGTCDVSTYERTKSDEEAVKDFAYISGGKNIYARAKGTGDVSVNVDGRILTVHVIVTNPKFTSSSAIMYRTQSITVKLKGLNSTYSKVAFSSSNKNVATVTQKGVVKAKKSGRVRIYATVDYKKIYVLVEVSSKAGYQASKKAIAISKTKTTYSQLRRMSKGYYDCSSLVSRIYRQYGVYFGVKKGWSPTAAAIGKWCTDNKKVFAKKAVSYTKLLPGDIICYSYTRNGRFRNISHIEIYVGNGKNVSASSSNNRVVHYDYKNGSTVLVARPKK